MEDIFHSLPSHTLDKDILNVNYKSLLFTIDLGDINSWLMNGSRLCAYLCLSLNLQTS